MGNIPTNLSSCGCGLVPVSTPGAEGQGQEEGGGGGGRREGQEGGGQEGGAGSESRLLLASCAQSH